MAVTTTVISKYDTSTCTNIFFLTTNPFQEHKLGPEWLPCIYTATADAVREYESAFSGREIPNPDKRYQP